MISGRDEMLRGLIDAADVLDRNGLSDESLRSRA